MADADSYFPDAKRSDDYELDARFLPIALVRTLSLTPGERLYLAAALSRRR
jgi:hypothetical protein